MIRYHNFTLVLTRREKKDGSEGFFVRVDGSPGGSKQSENEATEFEFPNGFQETLRRLESRDLSVEELIAFGESLSNMLLPLTFRAPTRTSVRRFYHLSQVKLKPEHGLRIQIRAEDTELGKIPWEYVYVPDPDTPPSRRGREGFLALDRKISIVRFENHGNSTDNVIREKDDLRVTVMLSDGHYADWPKLNLDQEEVHLLQALEGVDGVELNMLRPGTLEQFESLVTSTDSTEIFHFSGHGKFEEEMGDEPGSIDGSGYLILAGENGKPFPLEAQKLAADLKSRGVRLAVLGACEAAEHDLDSPWSGVASSLVSQGIPAVVGMRYTVRDESAIAFSRRFYQAMAAGKSVDSAVSEGRLGIYQRSGSSDRDWGVPVAYMSNDDPVRFPKPMGPIRKNLVLFALSSFLMVLWFFVHAYQFVAYKLEILANVMGVAFAVIPLIIVAGRLIGSTVLKTWNWREKDTWFESLMRHRITARILCSALVVSLFMLGITTSISLVLDSKVYDEVEISIRKNGELWKNLPILATNSDTSKTLDGGIVFQYPWSREVEFSVNRPYGFRFKLTKEVQDKLKFGRLGNISLKVSQESELLEWDDSRAIRLILRGWAHDYLPDPSISSEEAAEIEYPIYRLDITLGLGSKPIPLNLEKGVVYFGAAKSIILDYMDSESGFEKREAFRSCLNEDARKDENLYRWMNLWRPDSEEFQHFVPTAILGKDQGVNFVLYEITRNVDGDIEEKEKPIDVYVAGKEKNKPITYGQFREGRLNNICMAYAGQ